MWRLFKHNERRDSSIKQGITSRPSLHFTLMLEPMVASCVCSNNLIYASTLQGNIYAIDHTKARISWVHGCSLPIVSTPAVSDNMIVIATFCSWFNNADYSKGKDNNLVFALDPCKGSMLWEFKVNGDVFSSPCIVDCSVIVLGSLDYCIYAIDSKGSLLWKYRTDNEVWCSPAYDSIDKSIIIGSDDNNLYSIELATGNIIWKQRLNGKVRSSTPCITDEHIFIGTYSGYIYCLRRSDGSIVWYKALDAPILSSPAYSYANSMIYFGCSDNNVYGMHCNGSIAWRFKTQDKVWSSPSIVEDNNTLFICSLDSRIYSIDILKGTLNWLFPTMDAIDASPCLAYSKMFIGSRDGVLYVFSNSPDYIR
jgi:outer membrane protein assembly factor BamB